MRRYLFLLAAFTCLGCRDRARPADAAITDVRSFAPLTPGDRWRLRTTPPGRFEHLGITAVDGHGRAVMLGTARTTIELLQARREGVWTVSPEGEPLVPQIVLPLRVGATTRYRVRQGEDFGDCSLEVLSLGAAETVAGAEFVGCVRQRRSCRLPPGGGLPRATTFIDEETRCPGVGMVRLRSLIDPPLPFEGLPSRSESVLVSYHVRGAPSPARPLSLADRMIVLPSDVSAVCGGATGPSELRESATALAPGSPLSGLAIPSDARPADTLLAFSLRDGPFLVEGRIDPSHALPAYLGEGATRVGFQHGDALVRLTPPSSCSLDAAARLEPLIRSMLGSPP